MLNKSLMQILTNISSPPPPIPWIVLPASNILTFTLTALMIDPTKKTMFAARRIGLRPKMSLILPHDGVEAAAASK